MKALLTSLAIFLGLPLPLVCQTLAAQQQVVPTRGAQVRLHVETKAGDVAGEPTQVYEASSALLVGNSQYRDQRAWGDLPGVGEDMAAVRKVLEEQHGFKVEVVMNQGRESVLRALD